MKIWFHKFLRIQLITSIQSGSLKFNLMLVSHQLNFKIIIQKSNYLKFSRIIFNKKKQKKTLENNSKVLINLLKWILLKQMLILLSIRLLHQQNGWIIWEESLMSRLNNIRFNCELINLFLRNSKMYLI